MSFLTRWFGRATPGRATNGRAAPDRAAADSDSTHAQAASPPDPEAAESVYVPEDSNWLALWQEPEGVARSYFLWLSGNPSSASSHSSAAEAEAERSQPILAALERQLQFPASGAKLVPRVPTVLPQLLKSLRNDKISGTELARQLSKDAVLVAELVREANSPYYKAAGKIASLDNAVMVLGQNGLRMLVARVAFRPVIGIQSGKFAKTAAPLVWEQAGLCAAAGAQLAGGLGEDPFSAYLAGLMQSVGLIVALRLVDQVSELQHMPCTPEFTAAFLAHAALLSAGIARQWDMPETVAQAIEQQTRARSEWGSPAQLLHAASLLAQVHMLARADLGQVDDSAWPEPLRLCYRTMQAEPV